MFRGSLESPLWLFLAFPLPQYFGRWQGPINRTLSFHECRPPKPYLMQKNLFELFSLTGGGDAKASGTSACVRP